jgi:hypothetical protein
MPYSKSLKKIYNQNYYKKKKNLKVVRPSFEFIKWYSKLQQVNNEFVNRCILPRHIYLYRIVMKEMLKDYFNRKIIKVNNRTELITQSYNKYLSH